MLPETGFQIFVGGCDRSGTTMVASMIGNHGAVNCLPESHFIANLAERDAPVPELLAAIERHPRFRLWGLELDEAARADLRAAPDFATLIDRLAALYGAMEGRADRLVWLDHAPLNIGAVTRLADLYPQARFVHVVRDGRAVAASWLPQDWGPRHILTVADTWARRLAQGLAAETALPERVLRLHYEAIVADPQGEMRRVAAFLGLDYSDAMAQAGGFTLPEHSRGTHAMLADAGTRVSTDRVEAWKGKLERRQIELFESRTGDLLPALGYPRMIADAKGPRPAESARAHLSEITGRAANLLRKNRRHGFGLSFGRSGAT